MMLRNRALCYVNREVGRVSQYDRAEQLRRDIDQRRIAFIDNDLDVAMNSVERALMELNLGYGERARELLLKVRELHKNIVRVLSEVDDWQQQQRLRDKHETLTAAIKEVERLLRPPEQQPEREDA